MSDIDWNQQETALCICPFGFASSDARENFINFLSDFVGQKVTLEAELLITTGDLQTLYKVKEKIQDFEIKGQRINQYLRWLV